MGVLIKSSTLAAVLRKSKRQPTRVLRLLMEEMFTSDELHTSTVRGKKGTLPALEAETMDAILCMQKCLSCIQYNIVMNKLYNTYI